MLVGITMDSFALTYLLLTFGACLGVYQIAAASGGFKGLCFFRNSTLTYLSGVLILGGTYGWFFTTTNLNMPHPEVEGAQQLGLFLLGALLALIVTFLISSLINLGRVNPNDTIVIGKGLEDLKEKTVAQAFIYRQKKRGGDK